MFSDTITGLTGFDSLMAIGQKGLSKVTGERNLRGKLNNIFDPNCNCTIYIAFLSIGGGYLVVV